MNLTVPAEPASIPVLRRQATEFARDQGAGEELAADVALVVSEAVTNAVKYAGTGSDAGVVELSARSGDDWLELRVRDRGKGFGKGSVDGLGLGLSIIARLSADLRIVQEGEGTEVRMRFPLSSAQP
jgi:anti-sigma regulatory factor (Ser/Thr protein kinase)